MDQLLSQDLATCQWEGGLHPSTLQAPLSDALQTEYLGPQKLITYMNEDVKMLYIHL